MLFNSRILAAVIFSFVLGSNLSGKTGNKASQPQPNPSYYVMGQKLVEQGKTKMALNVWAQAKVQLDVPETRIGVAFIKLVTQDSLNKYYRAANLMYLWGLSAKKVELNKKALIKMIKRMKIIAGKKTYDKWKILIENNDPQIYTAIRKFWQQIDITPATAYNERLIEHWQRIAYSRDHFNIDNDEPLRANDRARIYIRYGKPDLNASGTFSFDPLVASYWAGGVFGHGMFTKQMVRNYFRLHKYDIWIYRQPPVTHNEHLIYIFGRSGLVKSIGDFIPVGAYTSMSRLWTGSHSQMTPALILQLMYYQQLSFVDPFFGYKYHEIVRRLSSKRYSGGVSGYLATQVRYRASFELTRRHAQAPQQASTLPKEMSDIPISVYNYRLLNKNNKPIFTTFVESRPQNAFWLDFANNYMKKKTDKTILQRARKKKRQFYKYINTVTLLTQKGHRTAKAKVAPQITLRRGAKTVSIFTIPFNEQVSDMVFSAKLFNNDTSSEYRIDNLPFSNSLRGLGIVRIEQPDPLFNNPSRLQMGDLIVGYNFKDSLASKTRFPFKVANDHTIPAGKTLVVHIEVYHLKPDTNGVGHLSLGYQIKPDRGFFGSLFKDHPPLRITLNLKIQGTRYVQNLRIKTRKLPPDHYTLLMTATDKQNNHQIQRKFGFKIVEATKK